jgi:hypothetical protein
MKKMRVVMKEMRPEDDFRRAPFGAGPFLNEGWYCNILDPVNDTGIFLRLGILHNQNIADLSVLIVNNDQEVFSRIYRNQPVPPGNIDTGLGYAWFKVTALALLNEYRLEYVDDAYGLSLDVNWKGIHPVIDGRQHMPSRPVSAHREQGGRVKGSMTYRGKPIELSGVGNRDHAVGRRNWSIFNGHKLTWAVFDDDVSIAIGRFDFEEKGVFDMNWVYRDGKIFDAAIERFDLESDDNARKLSSTAVLKDSGGKHIRLLQHVVRQPIGPLMAIFWKRALLTICAMVGLRVVAY